MKKILSILGLIGVIGIGSFAFASDSEGIVENRTRNDYTKDSNYEQRMEERHNSIMEYHKKDLKDDIKNGKISEAEAEKWEEHYNYMDKFHNENGFGGCHGGRRGMGMGKGMRRGYRN